MTDEKSEIVIAREVIDIIQELKRDDCVTVEIDSIYTDGIVCFTIGGIVYLRITSVGEMLSFGTHENGSHYYIRTISKFGLYDVERVPARLFVAKN